MNLEEEFNHDYHGGEEINNMIRCNGHYLGEDAEGSQTVLFDNGNFYVIKDGNITKRIDGEDEIFIDKHLVKAIKSFIELHSILTENYSYITGEYNDVVESNGVPKKENEGNHIFIRVVINREIKRIDISNIFIPFELKHNGLGKMLVHDVYKIAQKHNYKLYLVQMVESFYNSLLKRDVKVIIPFDVVEITPQTNFVI